MRSCDFQVQQYRALQVIGKIGQTYHRETYPGRLASCVPMGCLATAMEFLRPTAASYAKGHHKIISGPKMNEELGHHYRTQIRTMTREGVIGIEYRNE